MENLNRSLFPNLQHIPELYQLYHLYQVYLVIYYPYIIPILCWF